MSAKVAAVESCEIERECTTSTTTPIVRWFRQSNNGETSLEDEPSSGVRPSTMNIEALSRELVEGAATTNKYWLDPSKFTIAPPSQENWTSEQALLPRSSLRIDCGGSKTTTMCRRHLH